MEPARQPLFLDASRPRRTLSAYQLLSLNLIVAVAYIAGAYVGLKLAFVGDVVTLF